MQHSFKGFFVEFNLRKKKWLLSCSYNSNWNNVNHGKFMKNTKNISAGLDQFSATYENLILIVIGDFNVKPKEDNMSDFLNIYNLKNLVRQKIYA